MRMLVFTMLFLVATVAQAAEPAAPVVPSTAKKVADEVVTPIETDDEVAVLADEDQEELELEEKENKQ